MLHQPAMVCSVLLVFIKAFREVGTPLFAYGLRGSPSGIALSSCCYSFGYRDEALSGSELTAKLEPAFLSGLRCAQPLIRAKFFEVFDNSMKRRVYERLLYVTCSQNWEAMGNHFWIKQCIEVGRALLTLCGRGTEARRYSHTPRWIEISPFNYF